MSNHLFPNVFLGDLHGRIDVLLRALVSLGLCSEEGRWTGGTRRLIQVGDLLDRGPEPLATLDLLMQLQAEARAAGGDVICLLGNHEHMALEAAEGLHAARMRWAYNGGGANYLEWLRRQGREGDETALPYPEAFFELFGPESPYGRWIRTHHLAVRVGDYVAVHAGWPPDGPPSVEAANQRFAADPLDTAATFGLLWARHQPDAEIEQACLQLGCRGLIVGHTPVMGIRASAEGQLIQIDAGMTYFGQWAALGLDQTGHPWALIEGQEPRPISGNHLFPLPAADAASTSKPEPAPQLYGPGRLIRLYLSADSSFAQYLLISGSLPWKGGPGYEGRLFTLEPEKGWSFRDFHWPSDRIDRFGRPAVPGELPEDLLP